MCTQILGHPRPTSRDILAIPSRKQQQQQREAPCISSVSRTSKSRGRDVPPSGSLMSQHCPAQQKPYLKAVFLFLTSSGRLQQHSCRRLAKTTWENSCWESAKVSHKRAFALLTPEEAPLDMAKMLQKASVRAPSCQRMSANTLLCDTLALADMSRETVRPKSC